MNEQDSGNDVSEDMPDTSELTMCNPSQDKQKYAGSITASIINHKYDIVYILHRYQRTQASSYANAGNHQNDV